MKAVFIIMVFLFCMTIHAGQDIYPFQSFEKHTQFNSLIKNLRCLVCQNESLADSNAALAKDLRQKIYRMVEQGRTNSEIQNYLVSRYGDYILFKPPFENTTLFLWLFPFFILVLGIFIFLKLSHRK